MNEYLIPAIVILAGNLFSQFTWIKPMGKRYCYIWLGIYNFISSLGNCYRCKLCCYDTYVGEPDSSSNIYILSSANC